MRRGVTREPRLQCDAVDEQLERGLAGHQIVVEMEQHLVPRGRRRVVAVRGVPLRVRFDGVDMMDLS